MMRALLVVLCLLLSVATASAECAWVFWMEEHSFYNVKPPQSFDKWFLYSSYSGQVECEQALEAKAQEMATYRTDNPAVTHEIKRSGNVISSVVSTSEGKLTATSQTRLLCLPDTVDPRGPKEK
jgi:hypothetical protein